MPTCEACRQHMPCVSVQHSSAGDVNAGHRCCGVKDEDCDACQELVEEGAA